MNQFAQRLMELQELEETRFLADFHQSVEKARQKSWHDRHIKTKSFAQGDKVLLYTSSRMGEWCSPETLYVSELS
jgi:hypothetical protein